MLRVGYTENMTRLQWSFKVLILQDCYFKMTLWFVWIGACCSWSSDD